MALQVWLPLNGNLNNQGLTNITVVNNGATVDNNGKIGKCYYFDGNAHYLQFSESVGDLYSGDFSYAVWLKPMDDTRSVICSEYASSGASNIAFELSASRQVRLYWDGSPDISSTGCILPKSQWTHIAITRSGNEAKFYMNGELKYTYTGTLSNRTSTAKIRLGDNYRGGTGVSYMGYMNDFRLYDHALSPKEVEILSRGLVCHYPLNNNGGGQPNLYDFESVASKWVVDGLTLANTTDDVYGNVLEITSPSSVSSQRIYRSVSNVWKADTKFTVSFLAKASKTAVVKMSRSLANYAPDVTVGTTWKRYSTVITCSTTAEGGTLSIQTSTASANIYITQIKLELGDKATVYCPGVGDSHYIPLGYDSTTEYDVSGYGYNGTKTGTFVYDIDTPRYSVCTKYSGSNYSYVTSPSSEIRTIAFWAKWDTIPSGQSILFVDGKSKTGFGLASNGIICSSNSVQTYTFNKSNLVANVWYHFVVVCPNGGSNTARKLYINGVEQTATSNQNYWSYSTEQLQIGKRSSSSDGLVGKMSDFRAYATALSAEQVAELYNTAVSVANNGTLMGYELVEV